MALLEAARWAPSCFGDQPWRFLVWNRHRDAAVWQRAFDCLSEGNRKWVVNAPLLMASLANTVFDHNGKPNRWAQYDTGAASENICLQAVALGLVAHQMGGFDAERLKQEFGVPEFFTPMAMIAVGQQADADILEQEIRERELGPRARKPLETRFFEGSWDAGIKA